ncbi:beta-N-acetylglucosaminidase precursor [Oceanobacillus picturae]|uniref:Beta-N-acetylglucosaminidase n=1 Tax=Oceanobacillus picturae TaxID=171693 RepID=A0A0U9H4I9_9BACI|nr:glucosaminidase domain-containing protein [Oceanobacillus picturae]GAQ16880.1 beta-N-acetylglucosaminidase precursor [Oceanobacillus picturae]
MKIYPDVNDRSKSITAGTTYTNHVYYIKRETEIDGKTYYRLSTKPSSGIVGWASSTDITEKAHTVVDKDNKTFYIKGTGSAYSDAWGGRENYVYADLDSYENEEFKVHLTEKVGSTIWYRGELGGKTVWIHPSDLVNYKINRTSKLGHIKSTSVKIYPDVNDRSKSITAGTTYTNHVYYIKRETEIDGKTYYRLSTKPSSGIVGWASSTDITEKAHTVVDKDNKTFYIKGTGSAYSDAWGGRENYVYSNLDTYKFQMFKVHLTEKVGNSIWYRGELSGKKVWINEDYLSAAPFKTVQKTYSKYNLSLDNMVKLQMAVNPQTDKRYKLWIREDAFKGNISNGQGTVQGSNWNLRRGPSTNFQKGGQVGKGTVLPLISSINGSDGYKWYHVRYTSGWVTPDVSDVKYYLNPQNFLDSLKESLQFLKLSESANINENEVNNKILKGKGILEGKAQFFVDGARTYGVNEIYLISHALLETGNGSSSLATGVEYKGKTVYNMYGIGAKDSCPVSCGSEYAYKAGWFTPEAAIIGGAAFVGENYLGVGQDTLYKMRWNPDAADRYGYATHQYATDIGWASKQTVKMYELYSLLEGYNMILDIPEY